MSQIGSVPLYLDQATGEVYVDPNDVESGAIGDRFREHRAARLERRIGRLQNRQERLMSGGESTSDYAPADLRQAAAQRGMVAENQYNGLGSIAIAASGTAFLSDQINRNLWGKSLVLNSDDVPSILVDQITVAGLPVHIGTLGTPLSMFQHDSTRFGISFGRKLALVGQTFRVDLSNIDAGGGHTVSGGIIADELNPYAMQAWMENMLLQAVVTEGFGYGS